jgi:hypothetical protein
MNPPYIATNIEELLDSAPEEILAIIDSDEVNSTAATLGKIYKLPMEAYLPLSNIIYLTLIGAIQPQYVVKALEDMLHLSSEDAYKLAQDLDTSLLQKARISIFEEASSPVKTLEFVGKSSPDELRKEILDTTKRGTPQEKAAPQTGTPQIPSKKQIVLAPGSRSQLLEQLQIIGLIPKDEEVEARLSHIKEQIQKIDENAPKDNTLDANVALKDFIFGEKGKKVVDAVAKSATYSKAPTRYNVDPYREVSEE